MILLATNERDLTTDYVVMELQARRIAFFRLNTETLETAAGYVRGSPGDGWTLRTPDGSLALADVSAGYFRRPGAIVAPPSVSANARDYCGVEWSALLKSVYWQVGDRWLNSPLAIAAAEDKPRQLALAAAMGFSVPETLVTNDFQAARAFVADGPCVVKPLRQALLGAGEQERVIFTTRLMELRPEQEAGFRVAPVILQREIIKACDVRATVVGGDVFAVAIDSQSRSETEVDWRRGGRQDLRHEIHQLPDALREACVAMTKALGLRFSAMDFVLGVDGRYWFLESHPNGQWAWIENRTGLKISAAIVSQLESIAVC